MAILGSTRRNEPASGVGLPASKQGARDGVLQKVALGPAAADALMRRQDRPKFPNRFVPLLTGEGVEASRNRHQHVGGRAFWIVDKRTEGVTVARHREGERCAYRQR